LKLAYWIVAGLLAAVYLYSGAKKATQSQAQLQPMMAWAGTSVPMPLVRLIGVIEIAGAVGLIVPPLVGIAPVLAMAAAIGFVVLQVFATALHLARGETKDLGLNLTLIVLATAAAWLATAW
jgi:hypothetical protein